MTLPDLLRLVLREHVRQYGVVATVRYLADLLPTPARPASSRRQSHGAAS